MLESFASSEVQLISSLLDHYNLPTTNFRNYRALFQGSRIRHICENNAKFLIRNIVKFHIFDSVQLLHDAVEEVENMILCVRRQYALL